MTLEISQADNFKARFGDVLRSSAIFYFRRGADFQTTVTFMNYWKAKRGIDVAVVASTRDLSGRLLLRERLDLERAMVINYRPQPAPGDLEGSVEIEVFATTNLVIPYAAVMAVYEARRSLTMVHSYARTYSRHEVEEGRTISVGEESCWTIRDDQRIRSFCVFHNGGQVQPAQQARLGVRNSQGALLEATLALPALAPYATVKLHPGAHLPGLGDFLGGRAGHASLSFRLGESFTRMLVGNESLDGEDCQATHSNFNYSRHKTDAIEGDRAAFMRIPRLAGVRRQVIVYPDSDPGRYQVELAGQTRDFASGDELTLPLDDQARCLTFRKSGGRLPTRIVTALVCDAGGGLLPAECSLGVLTHLQPPKRTWWGLCADDQHRQSWLVIHDLPEIYAGMPATSAFTVRLFSSAGHQPLERSFSATELPRFEDGVNLHDIFPEAATFLHQDFGYYVLGSDYGGLTCYSFIRNARGGFTLEHGF